MLYEERYLSSTSKMSHFLIDTRSLKHPNNNNNNNNIHLYTAHITWFHGGLQFCIGGASGCCFSPCDLTSPTQIRPIVNLTILFLSTRWAMSVEAKEMTKEQTKGSFQVYDEVFEEVGRMMAIESLGNIPKGP